MLNTLRIIIFRGLFPFIPQVLRSERVSKSCDIYSYGILLFEIATLEMPFSDVSSIMVPSMIAEGKVGIQKIVWEYPYTNLLR